MSAVAPPLLSAGALRADGRRPTELRGMRCSTCCSPLHLLPLSFPSIASRRKVLRKSSPSNQRGEARAPSNAARSSNVTSGMWRSVGEEEEREEEGMESDNTSKRRDLRKRVKRSRTRAAVSFPVSSAAEVHADGRGVVSLGCTKVAVFVFGPRPLLRGGGGGGGGAGAAGGLWSEGPAAASSYLRAAEESENSSGGKKTLVSGAGMSMTGNEEGVQPGEEDDMSGLTDRCFDAYVSSAAAGGSDSKGTVLLCRAGIAPFSTGEVNSSSGEKRTVAGGAAAAGRGPASAAAAAFAAAASAGGGSAAGGGLSFGGGGAGGGGAGGDGGGTQQEQELALTVRKILQGIILEDCHPRAAIRVFIHVLEDDGGVLAASVCAAGLALIEAGIAVRDFLAAVSCVCPSRPCIPLLDPFKAELQGSAPTLTLAVLPSTEEIMLLQLNGKVSPAVFEEMYAVCLKGCRQVAAVMRATVREAAERRLGFAG